MLVPVQHNKIQKICCGGEFSAVSVNEKIIYTSRLQFGPAFVEANKVHFSRNDIDHH